ncbi:MAG: hypothetical protein AAB263_02260, partial [Planctomycetota bacterium]
VAQSYLDDGAIADACPPLAALLHIMATGSWNGKNERDPAFRALFTREALLTSAWYRARIEAQQRIDIARWSERVRYLNAFIADPRNTNYVQRIAAPQRLEHAQSMLERVSKPTWRDRLIGTIGVDPTLR